MTKARIGMLRAADCMRRGGLDGCAFRGGARKAADAMVIEGLLQFEGWGQVDQGDGYCGYREYPIWSITDAGQDALAKADREERNP